MKQGIQKGPPKPEKCDPHPTPSPLWTPLATTLWGLGSATELNRPLSLFLSVTPSPFIQGFCVSRLHSSFGHLGTWRNQPDFLLH
jgi:hypothetical protein